MSGQNGVPTEIRTLVAAVKGRCPGPLDDGDVGRGMYQERASGASRVSSYWPGWTGPCWTTSNALAGTVLI
jgi:hypothetical protein